MLYLVSKTHIKKDKLSLSFYILLIQMIRIHSELWKLAAKDNRYDVYLVKVFKI